MIAGKPPVSNGASHDDFDDQSIHLPNQDRPQPETAL
jgi:hypothetical protein